MFNLKKLRKEYRQSSRLTHRIFLKYLILFIMIIIMINLSAETIAEPPVNFHETGAGTEENPFQIANLANLRWLSENRAYWGSPRYNNGNLIRYYYIQTADIDATETIHWNDGKGISPIGLPHILPTEGHYTEFFGHYDGKNFKIINLYQKPIAIAGLFGAIWRAVIKNINLQNITVHIDHNSIFTYGTLIGDVNDSTITNCSVSGSMYFRTGNGYGTIGGLIGDAGKAIIELCSSSVRIIGGEASSIMSLGGLVGSLHQTESVLKNSYFNGYIDITTTGSNQGALVGFGSSKIENCYVTSINSFNNVDKLIGRFFVPYHPLHIDCIIENNFWDAEKTGITALSNTDYECESIKNNYGKSTAEMKQEDTYTEYDWDFENVWGIRADINDGYPYLLSQSGEISSNYDITNIYDMNISAYPNPFNPDITISFTLKYDSFVTIEIYNIRGQLINTIIRSQFPSGTHQVVWNGVSQYGQKVSSGVYFYRVENNGFTQTKKILLLK